MEYLKSRPYDEWRKHYGWEDNEEARENYAKYQKQLDILTPEKRKPGRPATGNAMTPAEKQRAYRERMKNEGRERYLERQLKELKEKNYEYMDIFERNMNKKQDELEKVKAQLHEEQKMNLELIKQLEKIKGNVTHKWNLQYKTRDNLTWTSTEGHIESTIEELREIIQSMGVSGGKWRAVNQDGLIYAPPISCAKD